MSRFDGLVAIEQQPDRFPYEGFFNVPSWSSCLHWLGPAWALFSQPLPLHARQIEAGSLCIGTPIAIKAASKITVAAVYFNGVTSNHNRFQRENCESNSSEIFSYTNGTFCQQRRVSFEFKKAAVDFNS